MGSGRLGDFRREDPGKKDPENPRSARVAERIQTELGSMLIREVKDPRVRHVGITRVDVSPDLRSATVYFSRYGEKRGDEQEINEGLEGLERAKGYLQSMLGNRLQLRRVPKLEFRVDNGLPYGENIERIFNELQDRDDQTEREDS